VTFLSVTYKSRPHKVQRFLLGGAAQRPLRGAL
jgi:hypothetical protein